MGRSWRRWVDGILLAVTVVTVTFAIEANRLIERYTARIELLGMVADRAGVRDALIGADVGPQLAAISDGAISAQTETRDHLVWIVDVATCFGCLARADGWRLMAADTTVDRTLILVGASPLDAMREARRAGVHGRVVADADRTTDHVLGSFLPDTRLLVDSDGLVLMGDSRHANSVCEWDFFMQVAAARGITSARYVRKGGSPTRPHQGSTTLGDEDA